MTSRMPVPEPSLETARLVLRIPGVEDFAGWAQTQGDAEVMRYLGGPAPAIGAWKHMLAVVGSWHVQGFGCFSVIDKASGRWLGLAGPVRHAGWPGNEIGWTFAPEAWGHGYATEAAEAATAWAFGSLGWDAVIHCIDPDNAPSQAVARRLGSRNQGPVRLPPPYDARRIDLWGQTRAQWEERHPAPQQGRA